MDSTKSNTENKKSETTIKISDDKRKMEGKQNEISKEKSSVIFDILNETISTLSTIKFIAKKRCYVQEFGKARFVKNRVVRKDGYHLYCTNGKVFNIGTCQGNISDTGELIFCAHMNHADIIPFEELQFEKTQKWLVEQKLRRDPILNGNIINNKLALEMKKSAPVSIFMAILLIVAGAGAMAVIDSFTSDEPTPQVIVYNVPTNQNNTNPNTQNPNSQNPNSIVYI